VILPFSVVLWIGIYITSSLLILEFWKAYAHLFCDPEDDPHSTFTYVVVLIFGPLIFVAASLQRLAEYLIGRRDDR